MSTRPPISIQVNQTIEFCSISLSFLHVFFEFLAFFLSFGSLGSSGFLQVCLFPYLSSQCPKCLVLCFLFQGIGFKSCLFERKRKEICWKIFTSKHIELVLTFKVCSFSVMLCRIATYFVILYVFFSSTLEKASNFVLLLLCYSVWSRNKVYGSYSEILYPAVASRIGYVSNSVQSLYAYPIICSYHFLIFLFGLQVIVFFKLPLLFFVILYIGSLHICRYVGMYAYMLWQFRWDCVEMNLMLCEPIRVPNKLGDLSVLLKPFLVTFYFLSFRTLSITWIIILVRLLFLGFS